MAVTKEVEQGQAVYSKPVLWLYDLWVLGAIQPLYLAMSHSRHSQALQPAHNVKPLGCRCWNRIFPR